MSNNRDYYHSSSRTSRNDVHDTEREERLPSLHNAYGTTSSTYTYQDIKRPHVSQNPSHDEHDRSSRGPKLAFIYPSGNETYSSYSTAARSFSTRKYSQLTGNALASGSSRSSTDYPINAGHGFQTFYAGNQDLIPVSSSATQPQGIVRSCDIPDQSDDPRKRYKCTVCGKAFDRPSSLDTHTLRHTGSKPHACPASYCDKTFSVRSNMKRHYRKQHEGEEDDHTSTHQPAYSSTSPRGSSEQSPYSGSFYSSSRRR